MGFGGTQIFSLKHNDLSSFSRAYLSSVYLHFFKCLFLREREREKEGERVCVFEQRRGRDRDRQNLKQPPVSELSAQSPMWGLNS